MLHTTFKITESNSPGWRAGVWTQVLSGSQQGARPEPANSAAQDALLTRPFLGAGGGGAPRDLCPGFLFTLSLARLL